MALAFGVSVGLVSTARAPRSTAAWPNRRGRQHRLKRLPADAPRIRSSWGLIETSVFLSYRTAHHARRWAGSEAVGSNCTMNLSILQVRCLLGDGSPYKTAWASTRALRIVY